MGDDESSQTQSELRLGPVSDPVIDVSDLTATWPGTQHTLAAVTASGILAAAGDLDWACRVASVSKLFAGYAALIAAEEGTIGLDDEVGPPGATVRHLLAHTAGYAFDSETLVAGVGARFIYSNADINVFADYLQRKAEMAYSDYLQEGIFGPLGMTATSLAGAPSHDVVSSTRDLARFSRELLAPTLVDASTLSAAVEPQFPDLGGVLPGFGRHNPNPWGLGFEVRGQKVPHWTAPSNSSRTFGHFGGSGSFLWVDPVRRVGAVSLSSEPFGPWAAAAWPFASEQLLHRLDLAGNP